jgi:hypothetical protein
MAHLHTVCHQKRSVALFQASAYEKTSEKELWTSQYAVSGF